MRILDCEQDRALDEADIFLEPEEARQMISYLDQLLEHYEEPGCQCILPDSGRGHEISLSIYTESNLKYYDERVRRLVLEGK